jgi:NTP pyrophosphatase (non-canonical NTP hydrolase)
MSDIDQYQDRAESTSPFAGVVIVGTKRFVPENLADPRLHRLLQAALGLAGEAGEFADIAKKVAYQGHELDVDHALEELGDMQWYLAEAASLLGEALSSIAAKNEKKRKARYPHGFDARRSRERST